MRTLSILLSLVTSILGATDLIGVSTNTGTGLPTTMATPGPAAYSFTFAGLPAAAFIYGSFTTPSSISAYNRFGSKLLTYSAPSNVEKATDVLAFDSLTLVVLGNYQNSLLVKLAYSLNILSASTQNIFDDGLARKALLDDQGTNYILAGFYRTNKLLTRYDRGLQVFSYSSAISTFLDEAPAKLNFLNSKAYLFLGTQIRNYLIIASYSSNFGSIIKSFLWGSKVMTHESDNQALNTVFLMSYTSSTSYLLSALNLTTLAVINPVLMNTPLAFATLSSSILNFGPYKYLGVAALASPDLIIVSKATFTVSTTLTKFISLSVPATGLLIEAAEPDRYYLAMVEASGNNFQSYYLLFDKCLDRTVSGVCLVCYSGYYRSSLEPGNSCLSSSEFPSGFGLYLVASPPYLIACQAMKCTDCKANYLECTKCDTKEGFYLYAPTKTCLSTGQFPPAFGINLATGTVERCYMTGCTSCISNSNFCTACSASTYLVVDLGQCVFQTAIPAGYGLVPSTRTAFKCQALNCLQCSTNYQVCTKCNTAKGYYLSTVLQKCYLIVEIPAYYGINPSTGIVDPCNQSSGCINCRSNINICSQCNFANGYFLDTSSGLCVTENSMPTGYGIDSNTWTIKLCAKSKCLDCKASYLLCTLCDAQAGYFLDPTSGSCLLRSQLPPGFGIDLATSRVAACLATRCTDCFADHSRCLACDTAQGFFLLAAPRACLSAAQAPAGFGVDAGSGAMVACAAAGCVACAADFAQCKACDSALQLFLRPDSGQCLAAAQVPAGFGLDTATRQVKACAGRCAECFADFRVCERCKTGEGFFLSGQTCLQKSEFLPRSGVDTLKGTVVPCSDPYCTSCLDNYIECQGCDELLGFALNTTSKQCYSTVCADPHCASCPLPAECEACNTANGYFLMPSTFACLLTADIPVGYGKDGGSLRLCAKSKCLDCKASYLLCTLCDAQAGYFLDPTSGSCLLRSQLPPGFGIDLATSKVAACLATRCTDCFADHSRCLACDTAQGFFLLAAPRACLSAAQAPAGFGVDAGSGAMVACAAAGCVACAADFAQCKACDSALQLFLRPDSGQCLVAAQVPAGFGLDTATRQVKACAGRCAECFADFRVCERCKTGEGFFLSGQTCLQKSEFSPRSGVDTSKGTVVPCSDPYCTSCLDNYIECQGCDELLGFALNTTSKQCYSTRCIDINCNSCPGNIYKCTDCNFSAGYALWPQNQTCLLIKSIPQGYGLNKAANSILTCNQADCQKCYADFQRCEECSNNPRICRDLNQGRCLALSAIPEYKGCNLNSMSLGPCLEPGCLLCQENVEVCTGCDWSREFYLNNSKCENVRSAPPGFGLDPVTHNLTACQSTGCMNCRANSKSCLVCDQANGYTLVNSVCINQSASINVTEISFAVSDQKVSIRFSESVKVDFSKLSAYLEEDPTKLLTYEFVTVSEGFDLVVKAADREGSATVVIDQAKVTQTPDTAETRRLQNSSESVGLNFPIVSSSDASKPFDKLPIKIENAKIFNSAALKSTSAAVGTTVEAANNARTISTILLSASNPALAIMLDKLFNDLVYMLLVGSQNQSLPHVIFDFAGESKLNPLGDINFFSGLVEDEECEPDFIFSTNDFDCNYLANYGEDILTLGMYLIVNIVFTGINLFIRRYVPNATAQTQFRNGWVQFFFRISEMFGLNFFLLKVDGNFIQVLLYSIHHLWTASRSSNKRGSAIGIVFSVGSLLYYFGHAYMLWRCTKSIISLKRDRVFLPSNPSVSSKEGSNNSKKNMKFIFEDKEIQERINLDKASFRLLKYNFDGIRFPIQDKYLYYPLVALSKPLLVSLILVCLANYGRLQVALLLFLEVGYYIYALKANPKASKLETLMERLINIIVILYMFMAGLSFTSFAQPDPMNFVGVCMALLIVLMVAVELLFVVLITVLTAIEWVADHTCKKRKRYLNLKREKKEFKKTQFVKKKITSIFNNIPFSNLETFNNLETNLDPTKILEAPIKSNLLTNPSKVEGKDSHLISRQGSIEQPYLLSPLRSQLAFGTQTKEESFSPVVTHIIDKPPYSPEQSPIEATDLNISFKKEGESSPSRAKAPFRFAESPRDAEESNNANSIDETPARGSALARGASSRS